AIDQDVDADLLLERDPLLGSLASQLVQVVLADAAPTPSTAGANEVVGLGQAAHAGGKQSLAAHTVTPCACVTRATNSSFLRAVSRGRNSRPQLGLTWRCVSPVMAAARFTCSDRLETSSMRTLRASTIPRPRPFPWGHSSSSRQLSGPWTKSKPKSWKGSSSSPGTSVAPP